MLFYSLNFLFIFLPIFYVTYLFVKRFNYTLIFLILSSLIFYSLWDYRFVPLLILSILINYFLIKNIKQNKIVLTLGILTNLLILIFFKYSNFFINDIFYININLFNSLILPLGISFFTFQQISCLVDAYKKKIKVNNLKEYFTYVIFFPQLIAGPIVRYDQVIDQFINISKLNKIEWNNTNLGIVLFIIGFFKKVFFANHFGNVVDTYFLQISDGNSIDSIHIWYLTYNFALQIYFDFSAYTDMALGLGLLIGIKLPINFNSPYKSINIIEFWRSWHISLSLFFRDYLYIPLGGNRNKFYVKFFIIVFVMTVAGLWHGASWTFLIWGFIHGLYLGLTHLIIKYKNLNIFQRLLDHQIINFIKILVFILFFILVFLLTKSLIKSTFIWNLFYYLIFEEFFLYLSSFLVTIYLFSYYSRNILLLNIPIRFFLIFFNFTVVALLFIIFRSESFDQALIIFNSLLSLPKISIEEFIDLKFHYKIITYNFEWLMFLVGILTVFFLPNSNQILEWYKYKMNQKNNIVFIFNIYLGIIFAISFITILKSKEIDPFIYFIF